MTEMLTGTICFIAGILLGSFFYAGLWWTIQKGILTRQPSLLFLGSWLLRTGTVLAGFYFITQGNLKTLLLALIGFFLARVVVTRLVYKQRTISKKESTHAH